MDQGCLAVLVVRLTFLQVFIFGTCHGTDNYVQEARPGVVPRFLSTNTNLNRHRGDTAVLECAVENLGDRQVIWRKASSTSPITVGTDSFVEDARIEAEHPPGSSQWNLVIRDLRPEDAGVYECQVSSKQFRYLRHHVTLLVSDEPREPKKPNIQITGAKFVDEGEKIFLICNATAQDQPPDDLDWFRDGEKLQTSESKGVYIRKSYTLSTGTIFSTLEIKNARLKDAGFYVCRTSSLDVTSFRVNVLNDTVRTNERSRKLAEDVGKKKKVGALGGDTFNVKRGTENGRTEGMPDSHNAATQSSGLTLLLECVFFLGASFLFSVIT